MDQGGIITMAKVRIGNRTSATTEKAYPSRVINYRTLRLPVKKYRGELKDAKKTAAEAIDFVKGRLTHYSIGLPGIAESVRPDCNPSAPNILKERACNRVIGNPQNG